MNSPTKIAVATLLAAVMILMSLAVAANADAATDDEAGSTEAEPEYDIDLGEFWSYTIGFSPSPEVEGARSITWDFGDGSEPVTAFSHIHTYEQKGVYYVTQTCSNTHGDSTMVAKVTVLGYPYIEFDSQGGSQVDRIDMTSGGINAQPAEEPEEVPTKSGFTFTGWYTTPECTELYDWSEDVTEGMTLYAGWSENPKATVSFDVGDGYPPMEAQEVTVGTEFTIPAYDGTLEGWTFGGWSYDGKTYLEGQRILITESITLTAVWNELDSYTVTFDTDGGLGDFPQQTVFSGSTAEEPAQDPTRQHYTFAGWFDADGEPFDFEAPITSNVIVYAHWTPVEYTVSFDVNGGQGEYPDQKVPFGSKATNPGSPTKSGYSFNGWYLDDAPFDFDTPIGGDIELVADWSYVAPPVVRYTVTFDPDNGDNPWTSTVVSGNAVTLIEPTKLGYTFTGWFDEEGEQYVQGTPVRSDMTLRAGWSEQVVHHKVTFTDGDGQVLKTLTVKHGARAGSFTPSMEGYVFDGWFTSGGEAYDFALPVTGDVTLAAKWTQVHSVTVAAEEGVQMSEDVPQRVVHGDSVRLPEATMAGMTLQGWDTDGNGEVDRQAGETITVESDLVLKPIFEPVEDPDSQHKVTILDAPELPYDAWYVDGEGQVPLPKIEREGMTFIGWDTDGDDIADMDAGEMLTVTGDVTVRAIFEPKPVHSITIDIGDGAVLSKGFPTEAYEGQAIVLPDASRQGYDLAGWEVAFGDVSARTLYQPGDEVVVEGPMTVTAQWTALSEDDVQHTVTIDTDGGKADYDQWFAGEGETVTVPDVEDRPGYDFGGFKDQDGNVWMPGDELRPDEDTDLTAQWTPVESPEEDDGGDGTEDDWMLYAVVIIVIFALIALILILHYRVGVI